MNKMNNPRTTVAAVAGDKLEKNCQDLQKEHTSPSLLCQTAEAQRSRILAWLLNNSLTTLEARRSLDVLHPAARVMELRQRGYQIQTVWTDDLSDAGERHRGARYVLQQQGEVE